MAQSIRKTINKILDSKEYTTGTREDHERILIELCFLVFDATRLRAKRTYGKAKWYNSVHISSELSNIEPPEISMDIN